jgi:phosphodiesterase/alkaline phosphatase D-like protein
VPIQQFWALPYDRWEGYGAERNEILSFIRDNVSGVIFLTTDMHANLINDVAIDTFLAPAPIAPEFITGPIATNTFEAEILEFAAGVGLPGPVIVGAFHQLLDLAGANCRNLDIDAYALVEVTAGPTGTATISIRDENGAAVTNSNPFDPGNTSACMQTIP